MEWESSYLFPILSTFGAATTSPSYRWFTLFPSTFVLTAKKHSVLPPQVGITLWQFAVQVRPAIATVWRESLTGLDVPRIYHHFPVTVVDTAGIVR